MKRAGSDGLRHFAKVVVAGRRQAVAVAVVAVALGMMAGCATGPGGQAPMGATTPEPRESLVKRRAEARWDALIKGDFKASYAYLSPASRAVVSLESYSARTGQRSYREAKVDSVGCESETCRVRLFLTFDHRLMQGITTPVEETWVFDGGQAWFVYRE
jgi:hypothetical protein